MNPLTNPDRPVLGFELDPRPRAGARIRRVFAGSPAAAAGLAPGDVVRGVNGQVVRNIRDVQAILMRLEAGDEVRITCARRGKEFEKSVQLARLSDLVEEE